MKRVCVTPWREAGYFLDGWDRATQPFDDRLIVYNGRESQKPDISGLANTRIIEPAGTDSAGFGYWCNRGLDQYIPWLDTNDEIWILNNDIEGVFNAPKILPRTLMGPTIISTGMVVNPVNRELATLRAEGLPDFTYLDGWAIGANVATWVALEDKYDNVVPDYPGYYWEDPTMGLRAASMGFILTTADLGLKHLGGRTTRFRPTIGKEFCANRERFIQEVRETFA